MVVTDGVIFRKMPYIFRANRRETGISIEAERAFFMRLLKVVVVLVVLILAGLAGYAYFGDMTSDPREMRVPVQLDLGAPVPAAPADAAPAATPAAPDAGGADAGKNDLD